MIDKDALQERLKEMVNLPYDWDGFGSEPISSSVYGICRKLVEFIDPDVESMRFFVGVNTPGSAFIEIRYLLKTFEMSVSLDGTIFYDEYMGNTHLGSGSFLASKKKLNEVLTQ